MHKALTDFIFSEGVLVLSFIRVPFPRRPAKLRREMGIDPRVGDWGISRPGDTRDQIANLMFRWPVAPV
jgi:hypothetical protein